MTTVDKLNKKYPHLKFTREDECFANQTIRCSNGRSCKIDVMDLIYRTSTRTLLELAEERLGLRRIKWFKKA